MSFWEHSPGAVLRPLADTQSEVEDILKKKDPRGEIIGYSEVHLPIIRVLMKLFKTASSNTTIDTLNAKVASGHCSVCDFIYTKKRLYRAIYQVNAEGERAPNGTKLWL